MDALFSKVNFTGFFEQFCVFAVGVVCLIGAILFLQDAIVAVCRWWKNRGKTKEEKEAELAAAKEKEELAAGIKDEEVDNKWINVGEWFLTFSQFAVFVIFWIFIIGGIIGIALFGWDKLIEKLKDWF